MKAGDLKYTIKLLTTNKTVDSFGAVVDEWIVYNEVRSNIIYKTGDKNIKDNRMFNSSILEFVIRYDKFVNETMRVKYNERTYKIIFITKHPFDGVLTLKGELISVNEYSGTQGINNSGITVGEVFYSLSTSGTSGKGGSSGVSGTSGRNGIPGIGIGINGSNGTSGKNSTSGTSGVTPSLTPLIDRIIIIEQDVDVLQLQMGDIETALKIIIG